MKEQYLVSPSYICTSDFTLSRGRFSIDDKCQIKGFSKRHINIVNLRVYVNIPK